MKATGIVRRIDDLGRVVIPKEIRRTLRIREGDPLEIFVDRDGEVILKKYSPIGELGDFAQEYADSLFEATGRISIICDRDAVVAVAGAPKKQWMDRSIPSHIEGIMENRKPIILPPPDGSEGVGEIEDAQWAFPNQVLAPIVSEGDPIGVVMICSTEPTEKMTELELKLAETAAGFLAKQME